MTKIGIYTDLKGRRYFKFNKRRYFINDKTRKRLKLSEQQYAKKMIKSLSKELRRKRKTTKPYESVQPPTRLNLDTVAKNLPVSLPIQAAPQISDPAIKEFIKRTAAKESKYQPGSIHASDSEKSLDNKESKEQGMLLPPDEAVNKLFHQAIAGIKDRVKREYGDTGKWLSKENSGELFDYWRKKARREGFKGTNSESLNQWIEKDGNEEFKKEKQKILDEIVKKEMKSFKIDPLPEKEQKSPKIEEMDEDEEGDRGPLSPNQVALMKLSDEKLKQRRASESLEENKDNPSAPGSGAEKGGTPFSPKDNKVPPSGLNTYQIDQLMANEKSYLGTVPRDHIIKLKEKIIPWNKASFIANLDPHDKPGYHWVACVLLPKKARVLYFDSFGEPCPEDMRKQIKKLVKRSMPCRGHDHDYEIPIFKENLIQVQDADTMNCGPFAMMFIKDTLAGVPFIKATPYDLSLQGERKVRKYINSLPKFSQL